MKNIRFLIGFFVIQISYFSFSSTNDFDHLSMNENSAFQSSVEDLFFDKNGYLWGSSQMGVFRYDGSKFIIFNQLNNAEMSTSRFGFISPNGIIHGADGSHYTVYNDEKTIKRFKTDNHFFINYFFKKSINKQLFFKQLVRCFGETCAEKMKKLRNYSYFYRVSLSKAFLLTPHALFSLKRNEFNKIGKGDFRGAHSQTIGNYFFYYDINSQKTRIFNEKGEFDLSTILVLKDDEKKSLNIGNKRCFLAKTKSGFYFLLLGNRLYSVELKK